MGLYQKLLNKLKAFIIQKAASNHMVDIVEVRTKEIRLTSVITETDIRIRNSFFLPITILSIQTELRNRDGMKVGRMNYEHPRRIPAKSQETLTTTSEISIITSLFQAISSLLMQHIKMQSVGIAKVRWLWWTFDIPVHDHFEIHPNKLKIIKEETAEEKVLRKKKEAEWKEKREHLKEKREAQRGKIKERMSEPEKAEEIIPEEEKEKIELIITNEQELKDSDHTEVTLDADAVRQMAEENNSEKTEEPD